MNNRQRRILVVVAIVTGAMMLYPPLYRAGNVLDDFGRFYYGWIFNASVSRVEVGVLFAQFLTVWVIGGITYFLYADKR